MSATGGATEHHFGAVDETTMRLVTRCARVEWLRKDESASPVSPRKYLNVEMPGAMASSLSVVEVTTQKEKPGVMTGSREKEEQMERERERVRTARSEENARGPDGDQREGSWHEGQANGREPLERSETIVVIPEKSPFEVEGEA